MLSFTGDSLGQLLTESQAPISTNPPDGILPLVSIERDILADIGSRLKTLRDASDLSQEDFAPLIGLTPSHLSKVERGKYALKGRQIDKLAKKYPEEAERIRHLVAKLKGLEIAAEAPAQYRTRPTRREGYLPLVGRAACGPWIEAIERDRDTMGERTWVLVGKNLASRAKAFLVEAEGDSMTGPTPAGERIEAGDYLLVEPEAPLLNGKVALVCLSGQVTVKVWRQVNDRIVLTPTNPKHKELVVSIDEFKREGGRALRITRVQPRMREL